MPHMVAPIALPRKLLPGARKADCIDTDGAQVDAAIPKRAVDQALAESQRLRAGLGYFVERRPVDT